MHFVFVKNRKVGLGGPVLGTFGTIFPNKCLLSDRAEQKKSNPDKSLFNRSKLNAKLLTLLSVHVPEFLVAEQLLPVEIRSAGRVGDARGAPGSLEVRRVRIAATLELPLPPPGRGIGIGIVRRVVLAANPTSQRRRRR